MEGVFFGVTTLAEEGVRRVAGTFGGNVGGTDVEHVLCGILGGPHDHWRLAVRRATLLNLPEGRLES